MTDMKPHKKCGIAPVLHVKGNLFMAECEKCSEFFLYGSDREAAIKTWNREQGEDHDRHIQRTPYSILRGA